MFTNELASFYDVAGSLIAEQIEANKPPAPVPIPPPPPRPKGDNETQIASIVSDLKAKLAQLEYELQRSPKGQESKRQLDYALAKFSSPDLATVLEGLLSLNLIFNHESETIWAYWPFLHGKSDQMILLCAKQFRRFLTHYWTPEKFSVEDPVARRALFNLIQQNTKLLEHIIHSPTKLCRQISRECFHELLQTLLPFLVICETYDKKFLFQPIQNLMDDITTVITKNKPDPREPPFFPFDHTKYVVVVLRLIRDFHQALFENPKSPVTPRYLAVLDRLLMTSLTRLKYLQMNYIPVEKVINLDIVMYEFYNFYQFYSTNASSLEWSYRLLDHLRVYLTFILTSTGHRIWSYVGLIDKEFAIAKREGNSAKPLLLEYITQHASARPAAAPARPPQPKLIQQQPNPLPRPVIKSLADFSAMKLSQQMPNSAAQLQKLAPGLEKNQLMLTGPPSYFNSMQFGDIGCQDVLAELFKGTRAPATAVNWPYPGSALTGGSFIKPNQFAVEDMWSKLMKEAEGFGKDAALKMFGSNQQHSAAPIVVDAPKAIIAEPKLGLAAPKAVLATTMQTTVAVAANKPVPTAPVDEAAAAVISKNDNVISKKESSEQAASDDEGEGENLDIEVVSLEDCCNTEQDKTDNSSSSCSTSTITTSGSTSTATSTCSTAQSSFEMIDTESAEDNAGSSFEEVLTEEATAVASAKDAEPPKSKQPKQEELFQCVQSLHADLIKSQEMISKLVQQLTEN